MTEELNVQKKKFSGRWSGLKNLVRSELQRWFGTRRWLKQALLWILLIDGLIGGVGIASRVVPELGASAADARQILGLIAVFGSLGTVILLQTVITAEKENGVASWILSKPVSRTSYVLAKVIGNAAGVLVSVVIIPGLIVYPIISTLFVNRWLPVGNFLLALGMLALEILFYLTLTVMLGTFFQKPAPVMALPLILIFGQQPLIGLWPGLIHVLPYTVSTASAGAIMLGEKIPFPVPLATTAGFSILFVVLAGVRFNREEF